ncbi:MAG: CoA transferase [Dehalococcoidia bacterium]|nr:CoA transferase [Dehalococcoidia bacterium]
MPEGKGCTMTEKCLSHLRVVEYSEMVAGPYCTKLLADLGAEVVKIELPNTGDEARRRGPFLRDNPDRELSGLFLYLNTNKLGVTLNPELPDGNTILKQLIASADVFVHDKAPVLMESLGLTYEHLSVLNRRLVMVSITPFGQTGPYRDYKAFDLNLYQAGGEGYLLPIQSPDPFREPVRGGGLTGECICGLSAAAAALAATFSQSATGIGQHLDISRQEVLMTMVQLELAMFPNVGYVRNRLKRPLLMALPMQCRDGYIMLSALGNREWNDLVQFMNNPAWSNDERFELWLNRHLYGDKITPHVEDFVRDRCKHELFHGLQARAVAAAPANTSEDAVKSEQLRARGFFTEVDHPRAGRLKYPGAPYKMSRTPWQACRAAPLLGEHNELIYEGRLGYTISELAVLRQNGAI